MSDQENIRWTAFFFETRNSSILWNIRNKEFVKEPIHSARLRSCHGFPVTVKLWNLRLGHALWRIEMLLHQPNRSGKSRNAGIYATGSDICMLQTYILYIYMCTYIYIYTRINLFTFLDLVLRSGLRVLQKKRRVSFSTVSSSQQWCSEGSGIRCANYLGYGSVWFYDFISYWVIASWCVAMCMCDQWSTGPVGVWYPALRLLPGLATDSWGASVDGWSPKASWNVEGPVKQ